MKLNLKTKFMIPLVFLVILGTITSTFISYLNTRKAIEHAVFNEMSQVATSTEQLLDLWINGILFNIESWHEEQIFYDALQNTFLGKMARGTSNEALKLKQSKFPYFRPRCSLSLIACQMSNKRCFERLDSKIGHFDF